MNKSAGRVIDIITLLASYTEPVSLTDIATSLCIPPSSTFALLETLIEKKVIYKIENKFILSFFLYSISLSSSLKSGLINKTRPLLVELHNELKTTILLGIADPPYILYIDKISSLYARKSAELGSKRLMYQTGLGKAILATYDLSYIKQIIKNYPPIKKTPFTKVNLNELIHEATLTKTRGFAIDQQEDNIDLCCIACPIYFGNKQKGAISASFRKDDFSFRKINKISPLVYSTALQISQIFGYTKNKLF